MKGKKLLSILISSVLAVSAINATYVAADPVSGQDTKLFEDIVIDFNNEAVGIGWQGSPTVWNIVGGNSVRYRRDSISSAVPSSADDTTGVGDYCLGITSSNAAYLRFYPVRGGWGKLNGQDYLDGIPAGTVVETSVDFAVNCESGASAQISINGAGPMPVWLIMRPTEKRIDEIRINGSTIVDNINISLVDSNDAPIWHTAKVVMVYPTETSGTGYASVYIDGNLILDSHTFAYEGTYQGSQGYVGKDQHIGGNAGWDADTINDITFTTQTLNDNRLWIDNLKMSIVLEKKAQIRNAIDEAKDLIDNAVVGNGIGQYKQAYVDSLKTKMADAWSVYNNKVSDYTGASAAEATYKLYAQDAINSALSALEAEVAAFPAKANTEETKLFEDIIEDFNETVDITVGTTPGVWNLTAGGYEQRSKNGLFGKTADPDDLCLGITRTNNSVPFLLFYPVRDGWGKLDGEDYLDGIPTGTVVETSVDFAMECGEGVGNGAVTIDLNGANPAPIRLVIRPNWGSIAELRTAGNPNMNLSIPLVDENSAPIWHTFKTVTVFPTETSGVGYVSVYIDETLIANTTTFTYSGYTGALAAALGKDQHIGGNAGWDGDTINDITFCNQSLGNNALWIDNLKMSIVLERKAQLKENLDTAKALIDNAVIGTEMGQYKQADVDSLKAKMADAWSAYNSKASDYTGAPTAEATYTLYTQDAIDSALSALTAETAAFPAKAVGEGFAISRSADGATINAVFKKKAFADENMSARLIVAVYDSNDKLLKIAVDEGNGTLSFTNVPAEGQLKELPATLDISDVSDAVIARAFLWDSLVGMEPILDGIDLPL